MDKMPKEIEDALKTLADFISNDKGKIMQNGTKEIVTYVNNSGRYVANCAMDSARATAKDACKQIILNLSF